VTIDEKEEVDVVVVGGGVVGLACASAMVQSRRTVCVLERHPRFGTETSTHNSGVIHAGIYYPPGTHKATLCVEGRDALYHFCAAHDVPHRRSGKLIIAASSREIAELERLCRRGRANGVDDLELVDGTFVHRLEPHVSAYSALWSPSTGIVDSEALVRALRHEAVRHDVVLLPASPLIDAEPGPDCLDLRTPAEQIRARAVVNAAGLFADEASRLLGGTPFTIHPCRGEYAELLGRSRRLIRRPVYPVPAPVGEHLGVHLTPTTWDTVMVGPTIRYQEEKDDHETDRLPTEAFIDQTQRLLPSVAAADVRLGGTGIRAKLSRDPAQFSDFLICRDPAQPRLIQAAGIDSPGLTASLAIGRVVAGLVDDLL